MDGRIHIGTAGWHYRHWVGPFYPEGTKPGDFLAWYARSFTSVEIDNTFYHLPERAILAGWREATPPGFVFACKASRYITHMKKLGDPARSVARFFGAISALENKLGPVLFQLPSRWRVDVEKLARFIEALPPGYRYAFEFRDESWFVPEVRALLQDYGAALCISDFNGRCSPILVTAGFAYVRLHGPDAPYRGTYDKRALENWRRRCLEWSHNGLDVYCYFDNDEAGYAAQDAARLAAMVAGHARSGQ